MSKSILIIDTPENCRNCPCHFTDMVTLNPKEGENFFVFLCGANNKELGLKEMNSTRPSWCPLKRTPQKLAEENRWFSKDYAVGYNACIDEILKECD